MNKESNFDINTKDFELAGAAAEADESFKTNYPGFFMDSLRRLLKSKWATAAIAAVFLISLMSVAGPLMNSFGYNEQAADYINIPPRIPFLAPFGVFDGTRILYNRRADSLNDPERYPRNCIIKIVNTYTTMDTEMCDVKIDYYKYCGVSNGVNFWFGTDYLGRDLWTRVWRGARISLLIALISVLSGVIAGVLYGSAAGYYGGKADLLMMRFTEIAGAFPQSIIAALLILIMGSGIRPIIIALAVRGWIGVARITRVQFIRFRGREYVLAAKTLGAGDFSVIFRHILPNAAGPVVTRAVIDIPEAIFSEAFLAFIGLGLQAPEPSVGVLLADASKVLITYPYQTIFPALLISTLMLSFNLLGNALREAFDPLSRGRQ